MRIMKQSEVYDLTTLINFHSNEYSQEFHYYIFVVKIDRCVGSCNTLNDLIKYMFQIKQKI